QRAVEQAALDEGDVVGHEGPVPAGQVVQHDDVEPLAAERLHHVRADVSGPAGHHPRHGPTLSNRVEKNPPSSNTRPAPCSPPPPLARSSPAPAHPLPATPPPPPPPPPHRRAHIPTP